MTDKGMNEIAPWGISWGRTSKKDYKNIVQNLSIEIQKQKYITLLRDQLYNGCSDIWINDYKKKDLNKEED